MKQKKDAANFNSKEHQNYRTNWEISAPEETYDHQFKVSDLTVKRLREQQAAHLEQLNERRAMQANMRSADRNDYNEQMNQEQSAFKTSLKVTEDRKKEMLAKHKAIWNE